MRSEDFTAAVNGWSAQNKELFTRKLNPAKKTAIKHSWQAEVKLEEKIIICMIWGSHSGGYDVFWDMAPCTQLKVNWRFGWTCRLHLRGWRVRHARNQHEVGNLFKPEDGGDMFLRNVSWHWMDYIVLYPKR
jgi:hypothetical protein